MDLFDDARDDVKVGDPLAEDLDQPEPLAIELHVLRKGALLREIVRVRPPPISERPVSLGLLVGEGLVDVLEPPPRQLDRLDDRARPALAVVHDPSLPDLDAFEASLAAQQVAVFVPASTSSSNSSARAGLSPNAKLSRSGITPARVLRSNASDCQERLNAILAVLTSAEVSLASYQRNGHLQRGA